MKTRGDGQLVYGHPHPPGCLVVGRVHRRGGARGGTVSSGIRRVPCRAGAPASGRRGALRGLGRPFPGPGWLGRGTGWLARVGLSWPGCRCLADRAGPAGPVPCRIWAWFPPRPGWADCGACWPEAGAAGVTRDGW